MQPSRNSWTENERLGLSPAPHELRHVPLEDVWDREPLALLRDVMVEVGEAAQTFAAVRSMSYHSGETFACVELIAENACLTKRTVERHLSKLKRKSILLHRRRERRRTPTYVVPTHFKNERNELKFAMLPRWAARLLRSSWAERAVFALVNSRRRLITDHLDDEADGYERSYYSVNTLTLDSGLSARAVHDAKRSLAEKGLIIIERGWGTTDSLTLNPDCPVEVDLLNKSVRRPQRNATMAGTPAKLAVGLEKLSAAPRKNGGRSDSQFLDESPKGIDKATAEPSTSAGGGGRTENTEIEEFVQRCRNRFHESCPTNIEQAVRTALSNGSSVPQLIERARWFMENVKNWRDDPSSWPEVLYAGFANCAPTMTAEMGWPPATATVELRDRTW
jgi:hypothetical protein